MPQGRLPVTNLPPMIHAGSEQRELCSDSASSELINLPALIHAKNGPRDLQSDAAAMRRQTCRLRYAQHRGHVSYGPKPPPLGDTPASYGKRIL